MGDEEVKQCKNCKKDIAAPNFVVHSAYCFRTVQLCRRCDEPYKRDCLEQHNEDFHATINCSYCDANIEKWTLEKHMTACFRRPISCRFCDITKPFDELSEHITFCGSRTDKCCTCKQFVLLRDLEKHQEICQSRQEGFERYNVTKYKDIVKETSHSTITDTRSESEVGATSKKKEKNFEKNAFLRYKGTNNDASYSFLSDKRIGEFGATSKTVYRRSASCQYCNTEMPLDELSEHKELCGARTEKCSICKQFVILREFEKHKVVCLKLMFISGWFLEHHQE
ncbi:XIAP-associated factor 1-like [Uloborus diversus]|uniref:XIAP-associated factor 1-like n=1 Tax=Uloborus diversus TaxID=327109 RepID=UPI0024098353|nr:XIAP-associated factor 1-like [Uloborus diversus]